MFDDDHYYKYKNRYVNLKTRSSVERNPIYHGGAGEVFDKLLQLDGERRVQKELGDGPPPIFYDKTKEIYTIIRENEEIDPYRLTDEEKSIIFNLILVTRFYSYKMQLFETEVDDRRLKALKLYDLASKTLVLQKHPNVTRHLFLSRMLGLLPEAKLDFTREDMNRLLPINIENLIQCKGYRRYESMGCYLGSYDEKSQIERVKNLQEEGQKVILVIGRGNRQYMLPQEGISYAFMDVLGHVHDFQIDVPHFWMDAINLIRGTVPQFKGLFDMIIYDEGPIPCNEKEMLNLRDCLVDSTESGLLFGLNNTCEQRWECGSDVMSIKEGVLYDNIFNINLGTVLGKLENSDKSSKWECLYVTARSDDGYPSEIVYINGADKDQPLRGIPHIVSEFNCIDYLQEILAKHLIEANIFLEARIIKAEHLIGKPHKGLFQWWNQNDCVWAKGIPDHK